MWKKLIGEIAKIAIGWGINAWIKSADSNTDGKVSKEEAYNWVVDLLDSVYKKKN